MLWIVFLFIVHRVKSLLELPAEADLRSAEPPQDWAAAELAKREEQQGGPVDPMSVRGLPNEEHPSDHLPIMAELVLLQKS